jgi:hypothetical protein
MMNRSKTIGWIPVMLLVGALLFGACARGTTPTTVPGAESGVAGPTPKATTQTGKGSAAGPTPEAKTPTSEGNVAGSTPETEATASEGSVARSTPEVKATATASAGARSMPEAGPTASEEGAAGSTPVTGQQAPPAGTGAQAPSAYPVLAAGSILGSEPAEPSAMVVTQPDQLAQLRSMFPPGTPLDNITPALLDGNHVIVAIFGGVQNSSGYSVRLQGIRAEGGQVVLEVSLAGPPPNTLTEPALQVPYTIVLVERSTFPAEIGNVIVELHKN